MKMEIVRTKKPSLVARGPWRKAAWAGLFVLVLLAAGCKGKAGVTGPFDFRFKGDLNLEVSGTPGKKWRATIIDSDAINREVAGEVPAVTSVRVTVIPDVGVAAIIQKYEDGSWTLTACIEFRGDRRCGTTTEAFGLVVLELFG